MTNNFICIYNTGEDGHQLAQGHPVGEIGPQQTVLKIDKLLQESLGIDTRINVSNVRGHSKKYATLRGGGERVSIKCHVIFFAL